ncbi:DNA cytosine methyltransferase [Kribbella shirazensis]|uniref:DNA (cytosine-5-)-methyltransferase n=1 Tax=Kribbella shirazensis TaxID=1105143 RepID=A0A7X5VBT8_9ACTN|nr:DNA cytosine methyltransferase [Kribbella shirazensis]NIK58243.1 DNA (cytosine-5)-methyltransferase 1 [Kribbella shirazensis]
MTREQNGLPSELHMVDLFAGPGGLDVAARWLGISVEGIEWDDDACETRRAAGLSTIQGDVRAYEAKEFSNAKVLAGGPPCQTYTVAGSGSGRRALSLVVTAARRMASGEDAETVLTTVDERTRLVLEPLRWILDAHRAGDAFESIVLEQVPAVLPVWRTIREVLLGLDYSCECEVLQTEQYGVPQTRRRAILIARRKTAVVLPKPTHRPFRQDVSKEDGDQALRPWRTMEETLDRPTPFTVISNYGTGGDPKNRGRRRSDQPSATVTGKISRNRIETPDGDDGDRFTSEEAGALQTFPRDYPWSGRDKSQQIGNAIPPRLAAHVLAAALGMEVDTDSLDDVMTRNWFETESGSVAVRPVARTTAASTLFETI